MPFEAWHLLKPVASVARRHMAGALSSWPKLIGLVVFRMAIASTDKETVPLGWSAKNDQGTAD